MTATHVYPFLAQQTTTNGEGPGIVFIIVWLAIMIVVIAGAWKAFEKAGRPGWGVLIPIYNAYLMIKIAGRPGWWLLLLLIPFLNIVFIIIVMIDIAKNFGRGALFGLGLAFLGFIFWPILGFGDARYIGSPEERQRGFAVMQPGGQPVR